MSSRATDNRERLPGILIHLKRDKVKLKLVRPVQAALIFADKPHLHQIVEGGRHSLSRVH
jgi:hypothetical protein